MDDFRPTLLQLLDNFHAREKTFLLPLETVDFSNTLFEFGYLVRQALVTIILIVDHLRVDKNGPNHDNNSGNDCASCGNTEISLSLLAFFLAPGE
jgi:hypothetical protein